MENKIYLLSLTLSSSKEEREADLPLDVGGQSCCRSDSGGRFRATRVTSLGGSHIPSPPGHREETVRERRRFP
jgi:hypothetical protein